MSDQVRRKALEEGLRPQVVEAERPGDSGLRIDMTPRVIATTQGDRIAAAPPAERLPVPAPRRTRRSRVVRVGLWALAAGFAGWLGVDLYLWIASAFAYGGGLGWLAAAAAGAGIVGAGAIILREVRSFLALRSVEVCQQQLAEPAGMTTAGMQEAIRDAIAVLPGDRETRAAIESFQRKVQRHHSPAQQLELFSQTVLVPLDRRAEAIVRRAATRGFGIVAISPTAITDALFFIALSVRMVREIAGSYGHRPAASATVHLLRRLLIEGGRLGAIDLAGATLTQHIGGAVAERVAASAAESVYAAQRMARLGLVTMGLCRPVPFRQNEVPGIISSLIGNLFARKTDSEREAG